MANTAVKGSLLPPVSSLVGNSFVLCINGVNGNTSIVSVANLLGNTAANVAVRATRVLGNVAPATSSSNGSSGDIAWDSNYIYLCVATNTWKRTAIAPW